MGSRETLLDFFFQLADSDATCAVYCDGYRAWSYSYRDVARAARHFAAQLQTAGLGKGDCILIWSENRAEWLVALQGALLAGVVVVPIDYRSSPEVLAGIQRVAQTKLLLRGEETPEIAGLGVPAWRLAEIDWSGAAEPRPVTLSRDDTAEILFTSGATADPKGVLISHRNVLANIVPVEREVVKYRKYARPFAPIRFLNLLPLSHMFGQAMAAFIPPMLGGVVVFMHGYNPREIAGQIRQRRISVLVCVPKILDVLKQYVLSRAPEAAAPAAGPEHPLKRWWRYRKVHRLFGFKFWAFVTGAAPLDPDLEEFWKRLGFVVVQGYGLTETAPIVTLNHPFHTKTGTVGKPIPGVEVKVAGDGEILVRGENVTAGYLGAPGAAAQVLDDGWLHTGDIGFMDESGRLYIRGRKKEMIVTPAGLNVFPEDVERVVNEQPGVRDSAVVGVSHGGEERVHAVLVPENGADPEEIVRRANARLEDHQKIRGFSVWTAGDLPRTEGTRKLKRGEIRHWVTTGAAPHAAGTKEAGVRSVLARYAGARPLGPETTLDQLGLSSLERVELMLELERRFGAAVDESALAGGSSIADLERRMEEPQARAPEPAEPLVFPSWNRSRWARAVRRLNPLWVFILARLFVWVKAEGLENLSGIEPPVIFAPNHQSHFDVPAILLALPAKWRYRVAPAMSKEWFDAHFHPERHTWREWFTNSLNYYLAALFMNAFPIPRREAGARETLRYAGELANEGWCVLIFAEGRFTQHGEIQPFQPGVGMLASRLAMPVVPVRLTGSLEVLPRGAWIPRPHRVSVRFGKPLRLSGEDYAALAREVERAVRG